GTTSTCGSSSSSRSVSDGSVATAPAGSPGAPGADFGARVRKYTPVPMPARSNTATMTMTTITALRLGDAGQELRLVELEVADALAHDPARSTGGHRDAIEDVG